MVRRVCPVCARSAAGRRVCVYSGAAAQERCPGGSVRGGGTLTERRVVRPRATPGVLWCRSPGEVSRRLCPRWRYSDGAPSRPSAGHSWRTLVPQPRRGVPAICPRWRCSDGAPSRPCAGRSRRLHYTLHSARMVQTWRAVARVREVVFIPSCPVRSLGCS